MIPRVMCIGSTIGTSNYPGSSFTTGEILVLERAKYRPAVEQPYFPKRKIDPETVAMYPNCFRPMPWYEGRTADEMPEYVKLPWGKSAAFVHKVEKWLDEYNSEGQPLYEYYNKVKHLTTACVSELLPATEAEYIAYQKKKK